MAVAALLLAAACGGGNDSGGNGPQPTGSFSVLAGGNNVPERYSSDLWVHGSWAYTGTWGAAPRGNNRGDVLKIWWLDPGGAPRLTDSIKISSISTVSDVQVS